jgi:VCBS repeat-containing protein
VSTNGSYSYAVNADALNAVPANAAPSDNLTVTVTDSQGATDTRTITFNVVGANDAPVAQAETASATEAGGSADGTPGVDPSGNVLQNDTDPDLNDSKTVTAVSAAAAGTVGGFTNGSYGRLTLSADGHYSYQVDNSNAAVQALRRSSDTLVDTFSYTMQDASGASNSASLTVTIHGANDTPQALNDTATVNAGDTVTQGSAQGVLGNDADVDGSAYGESMAVVEISQGSNTSVVGTTASTLASQYGTLTLAADGSYSYVADGAASKTMWVGETAVDIFTYTVKDRAGDSATGTLSLTISGVNLPPPPAVSITRAQPPNTTPATVSGPAAPTISLPPIITTSVLVTAPSSTASPSVTTSDSALLSNSATQTNSADARSGTVALHTDQQAMPGSTNLTSDASGSRKLESTDRGFQVERVQSQAALTVSVENQQKGGDRLFVYKGIGSTSSEAGQMMEYRVPADAFAHTNSGAVVQLEASLVDGSPLPQWLDFDPTSGAFSGRPPTDASRVVVIKVTARDDQGRETSTTFTLRIEGKQAQSRASGTDPLADASTLETPEQTILRVLSQRNQTVKRGSVPFSDQLKLSRQDPLIAAILSKPTASAHSKASEQRLG